MVHQQVRNKTDDVTWASWILFYLQHNYNYNIYVDEA